MTISIPSLSRCLLNDPQILLDDLQYASNDNNLIIICQYLFITQSFVLFLPYYFGTSIFNKRNVKQFVQSVEYFHEICEVWRGCILQFLQKLFQWLQQHFYLECVWRVKS